MESKFGKKPSRIEKTSPDPPVEVKNSDCDSPRDCLLIGSPNGWQLAGYRKWAVVGAVILGLAIVLGPLATWMLR